VPLSAGEKLGPYEILAPIGAGGMGEVWKARDTRLNRIVFNWNIGKTVLGSSAVYRRFRACSVKAGLSVNWKRTFGMPTG